MNVSSAHRVEKPCPRGWWGSPMCGPCNCDVSKGFNSDCNKTTGECRCKVWRWDLLWAFQSGLIFYFIFYPFIFIRILSIALRTTTIDQKTATPVSPVTASIWVPCHAPATQRRVSVPARRVWLDVSATTVTTPSLKWPARAVRVCTPTDPLWV